MKKENVLKKVSVLILALTMIFALFSAPAKADEKDDGEQVVLTFAAHFPDSISLGQSISKAKGILEEKSGGTMTLDMYFNESLMKQGDTFVGLGQGLADIAYVPSQNLSDVAMAGIFKLLFPTGAPDGEKTLQLYRDILENTQIQENLAKYNLYCLTVSSYGGKALVTSKKLVKTPEDLKGMNIAANGNDSFFFSKCGAGAVALANADYYSGLSNGLVDGLTNHYASIVNYNLIEVGKYITEFGDGLEVAAETYLMNLDKWNSLTPEQQGWVKETFEEISNQCHDEHMVDIVNGRQKCLDEGLEIYRLSDEELAAFAPIMEEVNSEWIASATAEGWDAQGAYDYVMEQLGADKE